MSGDRPADTPLRVTWQSRWGLPTGYSIHSEEMVLHLLDLGVEVAHRRTPWPVEGRIVNPRLVEVVGRPPWPDAPQVSYDQADLFDLSHPGYKVGFTMLEVDGLPEEWVKACNAVDEVWVPSRWGAETFAASGVRTPIRVMPLGFDPAVFHPDGPAWKVPGRFTFLSVFEWGERKAPEVLLRAWAAAFRRKDPVLLLLRVNNADGDVDVARQISDLGLASDSAPVAILYNRQLPRADLGTLYRSADAFVLPTRGEGWGMPILEAMACGLPVIATAWSGQTEFFSESVGYPVRTRALVPARAKCPYYAGFRWADPDPEDLAARMREVFERPDEAGETGRRAAAAALRWTWAATAERIRGRLAEIVNGEHA